MAGPSGSAEIKSDAQSPDREERRQTLYGHVGWEPPPRSTQTPRISGYQDPQWQEKHRCERAEDHMNFDDIVIVGSAITGPEIGIRPDGETGQSGGSRSDEVGGHCEVDYRR